MSGDVVGIQGPIRPRLVRHRQGSTYRSGGGWCTRKCSRSQRVSSTHQPATGGPLRQRHSPCRTGNRKLAILFASPWSSRIFGGRSSNRSSCRRPLPLWVASTPHNPHDSCCNSDVKPQAATCVSHSFQAFRLQGSQASILARRKLIMS